jgi:hypothetical protein
VRREQPAQSSARDASSSSLTVIGRDDPFAGGPDGRSQISARAASPSAERPQFHSASPIAQPLASIPEPSGVRRSSAHAAPRHPCRIPDPRCAQRRLGGVERAHDLAHDQKWSGP